MPDSEIDLSDIPELTDDFWRNAVRNPFVRQVKRQVTVRMDAAVLAWLKRSGPGYQTRMNLLLRKAMLQEMTATRPESKMEAKRAKAAKRGSAGLKQRKAS